MKIKKFLIGWVVVFLFVPFSNLQSNVNPYMPLEVSGSEPYYGSFSGQASDFPNSSLWTEQKNSAWSEQEHSGWPATSMSSWLTPSESSRANGWLELPYGTEENALKVPVDTSWGVWICALSGYAMILIFRRRKAAKASS